MAQINLYLALQRLNLGDGNWDTLVTAMQAKGENNDPQPNNRCHWRESLDGLTWIFEAQFNSAVVDVDWFIGWLSGEFGINPGDIGEATGYNSYGRFSTFSYPAGVTNRFRIGVFGFVQGQGWPSWEESQGAAAQYIIDNTEDWNEVLAL